LIEYETRKRKEKEEQMALQREQEEKARRVKELTKMHEEEGMFLLRCLFCLFFALCSLI
jgi:hypothetical protein